MPSPPMVFCLDLLGLGSIGNLGLGISGGTCMDGYKGMANPDYIIDRCNGLQGGGGTMEVYLKFT